MEKKLRGKTVVDTGRGKAPATTESQVLKSSQLPVYTTKTPRDKEYEPENFAKEHVSDILNENQQLRARVSP